MRLCRFLLLSVLLLAAVVNFAEADAQRPRKPSRQIRKMVKYLRTLERNYVEDIDLTPYIEGSIEEITSQLDPFSHYMSAEQYEQHQSRFTRRIAGIGAEFVVVRDSVVVLRVVEGSPAQISGLQPLDRIVAIDSRNIVGADNTSIIAAIQGEPSSLVTLSVVRPSDGSVHELILHRAVIPQRSIPVYYRAAEGVGYLKLTSFAYNTSADFDAALQELGDVHTLVLDLCDNRGGLIASAIDVVGHFLKKNSVVCSLKSNSRTRHYRSKGATFDGRVIVMVNGGSASASELVAAALQDWDRGVVVGRTTFGKGVGQHNFRFDDGSALHLTTMKVLSPSGRSIQRPFELGASEEYFLGMLSRVSNNRQNEVDTLSLPKFFTLNSSRAVYGNSGVHPDIVVKASVGSLLGFFFDVVLVDMLDKYRTTIVSRYPRCSDFIADFSFDASDIALFGGDDAEENERRGELLKMRMAFNIYPAEQYYPIYNLMLNDIYREALAVANSPQMADNILSGNN